MSENENDWNELDLSSYEEGQDQNKVDFELDADVKTEEPEPKIEATVETEVIKEKEEPSSKEEQEESVPELEGIETDGAQKRIRQLVGQRKERDEAIDAMKKELAELKAFQQKAQQEQYSSQEQLVTATEQQLQQKLESARSTFKQAYNNGDQDNLLKAQEEISDAQTEIKLLNQRKQWMAAQEEERRQSVESQQNDAGYENYDPKARDWAARNPWFGQDQTATAVALAIDSELKQNGYDPSSEDYYREVDRRLKSELPHKFSTQNNTQIEEDVEEEVSSSVKTSRPKQVVAGQSRTPAPKKVKLSQEDVRLAKKWNIPLERYAAEKAKADKADGEYTAVL
tara:strand:- start:6902 stop:7924 length:1023 start_codon:yes stop_codon:yes gene_type:complete